MVMFLQTFFEYNHEIKHTHILSGAEISLLHDNISYISTTTATTLTITATITATTTETTTTTTTTTKATTTATKTAVATATGETIATITTAMFGCLCLVRDLS